MLDFGKLFKKDKAAPAAAAGTATSVVVKAIATTAARADAVAKAADAAGFKGFTHRIKQAQGTVALMQDPKVDLATCEAVAISADVSLMVDPSGALLAKAAESFSNLGERKFAPGLLMALDTLQDGVEAAIAEGKVDAVKAAAAAFGAYASALSALPAEALKLEAALAEAVEVTPAVDPAKPADAAATPTAKADDQPAAAAQASATPVAAPAVDPLAAIAASIAGLVQKFDGLSGQVAAAKSAADEALALARKSDRPSVVAAPAKPGDVPLRFGTVDPKKSVRVPLMDTAFGKAGN